MGTLPFGDHGEQTWRPWIHPGQGNGAPAARSSAARRSEGCSTGMPSPPLPPIQDR